MRPDLVRWGGLGAAVLAVLFLVRLLGEAISGADVYSDDAEVFLVDLDDGKVGAFFATYAMLLAPLAMAPFAGAMVYALRDDDRPWAVVGAALLGGGILVGLVAAATYGTLIPLAGDFVDAPEPLNESIAADGDWIATTFVTLSVGSYTLLGAGTLALALLMLRAPAFPRWLGWASIVAAIATLIYFALGPVINVLYPAWLLAMAYVLWNRPPPEAPTEVAPPQYAKPPEIGR